MTADYIPSASSFAKLLEWLGPDRDQSAARYEEIRRKIIRFFICRGCVESEDLTDVTIDRVTRVVDRSSFQYVGNPILYFYGVAKKVHLEHLRQQVRLRQRQVTFDGPGQDGPRQECLERCLHTLDANDRKLLLDYYEYEPGGKSSRRQLLAAQLGIPLNALRIRLHRARNRLRDCVNTCMQGVS